MPNEKEELNEEVNEEELNGAEPDKTEKKFSEEELQTRIEKAVKDRLAREQKVHKESLELLTEKIDKYQDAFEKELESLKKEVPEPILKLLEGKDLIEQIEWLSNSENLVLIQPKKRIPNTPNVDDEETKPKVDRLPLNF